MKFDMPLPKRKPIPTLDGVPYTGTLTPKHALESQTNALLKSNSPFQTPQNAASSYFGEITSFAQSSDPPVLTSSISSSLRFLGLMGVPIRPAKADLSCYGNNH